MVSGILTLALCIGAVISHFDTAAADDNSGCPSWGCLPSGTFALSADLPGSDDNNTRVGVKWSAAISPRGSGRKLGCVSCQDGVVCATNRGYVSVDAGSGKVLWRYDNMTDPSLPILDIFGDTIGTDGRHLVKIDSTGVVQDPIIKIYGDEHPMYSIKLANDNLMLMVSQQGLLITYATNGIPVASISIRDELERENGTFLPVAQPVIYGKRAYILMQFVPDEPVTGNDQAMDMGLQRLYAIDLWSRMVDRIAVVWYFNFERLSCPIDVKSRVTSLSDDVESDSSVLVSNNTVYVSLGRPLMGCKRAGEADDGTLWALEDQGDVAAVVFKTPIPVPSVLALYDTTLGQQSDISWQPQFQQNRQQGFSSESEPVPVLWVASGQQIIGVDSKNGSVLHVIDISKLMGATCRLTSKVMVTRGSKTGAADKLLFAVVCANDSAKTDTDRGFAKSKMNFTDPFIVALETRNASEPQLFWKIAGQKGTQVVGQIANYLINTRGGIEGFDVKARINGIKDETNGIKGKTYGLKGEKVKDKVTEDIERVLVGTAVSEEGQHVFAIGTGKF